MNELSLSRPQTQPELGDAKHESQKRASAKEEPAVRPSVMAAVSGLSLADVLHQAPRLLELLQLCRSLDALLVTNTGLSRVVQQYVTHITIPDQSHIDTFAKDRWPNLQRMSLQSVQDLSAVAALSEGGWQISRLMPTLAKLDLDAIMALQTGTWPWQMLTDLAVYFEQGLPVDLHMLSTRRWPLLESLILCCGRLDDAQASLIFRADWPSLRNLELSRNHLMDLEGVDHNRWQQLESVCLSNNPVSNTGLQRHISAQWPKLTSCNLSNVAVNIYLLAGGPALTWHQLIEAKWPMLSSLYVFGNGIKATMMKNIVGAQFSSIKKLNLSYNALDSVAIGHLVKGPWLQLCDLHLTNALRGSIADCLVLLSTAAWPQLTFLWLRKNRVDATVLPALAKSKWPSLHYVDLSGNGLSRDDFRLMTTGAGGDAACDEPRDIFRKLWPELVSVDY